MNLNPLNIAALSRRRVLIGLGAACAAATASTEAGIASVAENTDLTALGDALPDYLKAYRCAADRVDQIVAEWSPQWPKPAPEIIRYGEGCKTYRGIDGRGIEMPWGKSGIARVPNLGTPESFMASGLAHKAEAARKALTKSKRGMQMPLRWAEHDFAAIAPARAYWGEVDRITAASGIESAQKAKTDAREALRAIVSQIMKIEENSMAGVIIKAQALTTWGQLDRFYLIVNEEAPEWAEGLANAIMRQSGAV